MAGDPGMETPLAPLEAPGPERARRRDLPPARELRQGPTFLGPVREGLGYALRAWRVLLAALLVHLALALTVVMPFQTRMATRLDAHAHGPALSGAPDAYDRVAGITAGGLAADVFGDAKRLEAPFLESLDLTVFWIVLVAWLFGALVNGGVLGTRVAPEPVRLGAFLAAGGRHYGRMLRLGIVFALAYYLLATGVLVIWAQTAKVGETWSATSETGWWGGLWRTAAMVVGFLWLRVAADLARADLVRSGRRSALLAVLRGVGTTLGHPLRSFGLALLVGVPGFLLLVGLGFALGVVEAGGMLGICLGFVVVELAVLVRLAARAAVLAGDAALLEDLAR